MLELQIYDAVATKVKYGSKKSNYKIKRRHQELSQGVTKMI